VRRERLAWGASVGGIAGYLLGVLTSYPIRLVDTPHSTVWGVVGVPGQPVIRWFGLLLNAGLGALVGVGAMSLTRRAPRWSLVWILAAVALALLIQHERAWFRG